MSAFAQTYTITLLLSLQKKKMESVFRRLCLGKLSFKDIQNFAILSDIDKLCPSLDKEFLTTCLINLFSQNSKL